jgi:hypothetical protein
MTLVRALLEVAKAAANLIPAAIHSAACRASGHVPDGRFPRVCVRCGERISAS